MLGRKNKQASIRRRVDISGDPEFKCSYTINAYNSSVSNDREEQTFEREKIKKMRLRRRKLLASFLTLLAVVVLAVITLSQYTISITDVKFQNQVVVNIDKDQYTAVANDYFSARPLERFSFFYNEASFSKYVSETANEIESADISERKFMSAELSLRARKPQAVWETRGERQFVDANGVVFSKNLSVESAVIIVDEGGYSNEGDLVSTRLLRFVGQVMADIQKKDAETVEKITIPASSLRYVEFWLTGRNYPIKAQIDRDSVSQAGDILNMLRYLDERSLVPSYIDLRIEGKGYWK